MIGAQSHIDSFDQLFDLVYKGDATAKAISFTLLDVAHTWDDIVDGDEVTTRDVNRAFLACIFELQRYDLWHQAGLAHHVLNCFLRWRDANSIESDKSSTDDDLMKCYMLRAGIYDIFVLLAYHLHGDEWAQEVGPLVRKFYGESPARYLEEIKNA